LPACPPTPAPVAVTVTATATVTVTVTLTMAGSRPQGRLSGSLRAGRVAADPGGSRWALPRPQGRPVLVPPPPCPLL
jgi:hypothetical protein